MEIVIVVGFVIVAEVGFEVDEFAVTVLVVGPHFLVEVAVVAAASVFYVGPASSAAVTVVLAVPATHSTVASAYPRRRSYRLSVFLR